jgi:hypothetical protein
VTRSVSEEKLVSSRRVQSLPTTEVPLTSGRSGNAGILALSLVSATPVGTVPAATVETEREVDDATAVVRATARFSLRSSAFSACWSAKCRAGFQAHPLCSPQGDTFQNARLAYDAGDSRPAHDIDGVPAVTHAIDPLMPSMTIMVCVCTASRCSSCVLAVSQIPILLVAQRLEHSFLSSLQEKAREVPAALPYHIGQLFSIDGSQTRASMCYTATASRPSRLSPMRQLTSPLRAR